MSDIDNTKEDMPLEAPAADTAEPMRLRGTPPRVTRLSRGILAGLGLVGALGVGGALIYALQTPNNGAVRDELYSTENRNTADGLNELPRDYTGPVLGPRSSRRPRPSDPRRPGTRTARPAARHQRAGRRSAGTAAPGRGRGPAHQPGVLPDRTWRHARRGGD